MIVVDASVWISVLLADDFFHVQSYSWFQTYSELQGEMSEPSLLLPEVAAGLRRRTNDPLVSRNAVQYLTHLTELHIVPIDSHLAHTAAEMAADYRLRGADAVYAALAYSRDVPLVTWDQEQIERVQGVVKVGTPQTFFESPG